MKVGSISTETVRDREGNLYFLYNAPLWYHVAGYQETATGYGSKLHTRYAIEDGGRKKRLYCVCYSNCGSCYFMRHGVRVFVY